MSLKFFIFIIVCLKFGFAEEYKHILNISLQNSFISGTVKKNNINSSECAFALKETLNAASQGKLWALKMLDASSKLQSGLAEGNIVNFGSFDECMAVKGESNNYQINGKYCLYGLFLSPGPSFNISTYLEKSSFPKLKYIQILTKMNGFPLIEAACIPNSCTAEDLYEIYNYSIGMRNHSVIKSYFEEDFCQSVLEEDHFSTLDILTALLLAGVGILLITCTSYDIYLLCAQKKPFHQILLSFSLYSNMRQLITVKRDPDQIPCINGIRFISIMWIILGHRYIFNFTFPNTNLFTTVQAWFKEDSSAIVMSAIMSVDTFFVISGTLVMYVMLLAESKGFNFNLIYYYLHRELRLGPAMFMVILIYMTFIRYFGYGPIWPQFSGSVTNQCTNNWWKSVLYIQNFEEVESTCVLQTWYLGIDTQLYILAPLLFIPIRHWPKMTITIICLLISLSCITGFLTAWNKNADTDIMTILLHWTSLYTNTAVRMNAWLIGSLLGYTLFQMRGKTLHINKVVIICLWLLSLGVMSSIVFTMSSATREPHNKLRSSFYFGFSKAAWSLSLSWIIFACHHGYGGIVNKFLSMKLFVVLGRLTYSIYLVHVGVLLIIVGSKHTVPTFSDTTALYDFWADLAVVLVVALFWSLTFESPIIMLGKILMPQAKKLTETSNNNGAGNDSHWTNDIDNRNMNTSL